MKNTVVKKPIFSAVLGLVIISIVITGVYFMFFHNHSNSIGSSVTDIEGLNLRLSGMRITEEYEISVKDGSAQISYYTVSYSNGEDERVLRKSTSCDEQTLIDALNSFDFVKWNGFSGEHPKGVTDGTMFSLTARLNGGQQLRANGSQNFPKHFHDFEQWLYGMLKDCEELS